MRLLLACYLLVLGGCTTPDLERRSACNEVYERGGFPYNIAPTDDWRLGSVPLWTTPARLRAELGEPDTVRTDSSSINSGIALTYRRPDGPLDYVQIGDSLAYPNLFELGNDPLVTDRGTFEAGAPLTEIRSAFPTSYRCRDWPLGAEWLYGHSTTLVVVEDTARLARVELYFNDGALRSVGVLRHNAEE